MKPKMKTEQEEEMYAIDRPVGRIPAPLPRKLNFLLVDDDDICLFIHRRVLELSDHCNTAHSAGNGKTALEILNIAADGRAPLPDVILLDMEMPVMNGIAFLEAFQSLKCCQKERISIVLLTSSVCAKDREYAMSLGVSLFLSKPFTPEALESVIQTLFREHSPS